MDYKCSHERVDVKHLSGLKRFDEKSDVYETTNICEDCGKEWVVRRMFVRKPA